MARDDAYELTAAERRDLIKLINEGKALNESGTIFISKNLSQGAFSLTGPTNHDANPR